MHARRRRCGRPLRQQRNNPSQELLSAAAALEERFAVPGLVDAKLLRDVPGCLAPGGLAPGGLPPDPDPDAAAAALRSKPPRLKLPPMTRRLRSMRRRKNPGREPRPRRRPGHRRRQSRRLRKPTPGK